MATEDVVQSVWGETGSLEPKDGLPATKARLDAIVAQLAIAAGVRSGATCFKRARPPETGSPREAAYKAMTVTVGQVEDKTWAGAALPDRAALWELTQNGALRTDVRPLPPGLASINTTGLPRAVLQTDFVADGGSAPRAFRLFELSGAPTPGDPVFVSGLTGTGIAARRQGSLPRAVLWMLGIAGVLLFLGAMLLATWTGRSADNANALLGTTEPAVQGKLIDNIVAHCRMDLGAFPAVSQSPICTTLAKYPETRSTWPFESLPLQRDVLQLAAACVAQPPAPAAAPAAATLALATCLTAWRAAMDLDQRNLPSGLEGWLHQVATFLTGSTGTAASISVFWPLVLAWSGLAALTVALGLGTKGRIAGIWIDGRNRVSLARAQVTLWTVTALGGYAVLAAFNVAVYGLTARSLLLQNTSGTDLGAFPQIPSAVAAALGIAVGSPMLSALILRTKPKAPDGQEIVFDNQDMRGRGAPFFGQHSSGLDERETPRQASIVDVFMGEEVTNRSTVDLARLQNVVITLVLVLGYASLLIDWVRDISPLDILRSLQLHKAVLSSLPDPGSAFASLLFISHATYLVTKAFDKPPGSPAPPP